MRPVKTIEDILLSLENWREERGLQRTVGNIAANIGEEIVEYLRAENDEQRVDALCDMFVFSVNALRAIGGISNYAIKIALNINSMLKINSFPIISHAFSKLINIHRFNQRSALKVIAGYSKTTNRISRVRLPYRHGRNTQRDPLAYWCMER